jgi:Putative peptidoglycan binding domain/D-alanyl-D-alanine carboxypeptidase
MSYPVDPMTKPSDLNGQSNGKLTAGTMVCPAYPDASSDGSSGRMHALAARAFAAFDAAVLARYGEVMTCTSPADCYRTYDQQYSTFMKRYTTTYLPGRPSKSCMGQTWYLKEGYAGAACPGNSNHGWSLARDSCYWCNNQIVSILANSAAFNWMLANARTYGLSWESQDEAWHIRYNTGDKVPQAVLDYEAGTSPSPIPPQPGGTYMVDAVRSDVYKGCPAGNMVKQCQFRLNIKGANPKLAEDGQPGQKTEDAIRAFQSANGLTADGRCGPKTWTKLEA